MNKLYYMYLMYYAISFHKSEKDPIVWTRSDSPTCHYISQACHRSVTIIHYCLFKPIANICEQLNARNKNFESKQ